MINEKVPFLTKAHQLLTKVRKVNTWYAVLIILLFFVYLLYKASSPPKLVESTRTPQKLVEISPSSPKMVLSPKPSTTPTPESSPSSATKPTATPTPTNVPKLTPTPILRDLKKGSTAQEETLYNKIYSYYTQSLIKGMPFTEFESDAVVDVNPETDSVQLGLKYEFVHYGEEITESEEDIIMHDFYVIKNAVEQDKSVIDPDFDTLRLFVITIHDDSGLGLVEIAQSVIDKEPQWVDWK